MYKRLAEVRADEDVDLIREELRRPVRRAAGGRSPACSRSPGFRGRARQAGLTDVTLQGKYVRFAPVELPGLGDGPAQPALPEEPASRPGVRTMLVPRPSTAVVGGQPIRDEALLTWAREVIDTVIDPRRRRARRAESDQS